MSELYSPHIRIISRIYTTFSSSTTNCGIMVTHNLNIILSSKLFKSHLHQTPCFQGLVEGSSLKYSAYTSYLLLAVIIFSPYDNINISFL